MLADFLTASEADHIDGYRISMMAMQARHADEWIALRDISADDLRPWEPTWSPDALSREAFKRRLRFFAKCARDDSCYAFLIFHNESGCLIGGLTMSNVRRGVTHSASIGYWMGTPFTGKGYMTEAVVTAVQHGFERMCFQRMEAACLPHNHASASVLLNAGFTEEGFARSYRRINGQWQDHRLFGIVRGDAMPSPISIARGRR